MGYAVRANQLHNAAGTLGVSQKKKIDSRAKIGDNGTRGEQRTPPEWKEPEMEGFNEFDDYGTGWEEMAEAKWEEMIDSQIQEIREAEALWGAEMEEEIAKLLRK
jgi:hypothetical protein